jgi:hypothetical protein
MANGRLTLIYDQETKKIPNGAICEEKSQSVDRKKDYGTANHLIGR